VPGNTTRNACFHFIDEHPLNIRKKKAQVGAVSNTLFKQLIPENRATLYPVRPPNLHRCSGKFGNAQINQLFSGTVYAVQ